MTDIRYTKKVLYIIIQDLAELWLGDHEQPRVFAAVRDRHFKTIAQKILEYTGVSIHSRTLRNYVHGQIGNQSQLLDPIGAAWLVTLGHLTKKDVRRTANGTADKFKECVEVFRQRKAAIMSRFGEPEGSTLEYKEEVPAKAEELAPHLSAFGNTSGGLVIIGVDNHSSPPTKKGLRGDEPALVVTRAALGRLAPPQPHIEYGWSYLKDEDKLLFFIQVPPPQPSQALIRANGIAYERKGSSTSPIDQDRSRRGAECKATTARYKLLLSLRRALLITEPEGKFSSQDFSVAAVLALLFIAETFVTYLVDLMSEIHSRTTHPDFVGEMNHTIEHRLEFLRRGNIDAFLTGMKALPALSLPLEQDRDALAMVFQLARIWRCNSGRMDEVFVRELGGELHHERHVEISEVREFIGRLNAIARNVDLAADTTYRLEELLVEDLPTIA